MFRQMMVRKVPLYVRTHRGGECNTDRVADLKKFQEVGWQGEFASLAAVAIEQASGIDAGASRAVGRS